MSNDDLDYVRRQIAALRELVLARQVAPPAAPEQPSMPAKQRTKAKAKPRPRKRPAAAPKVPDLSSVPTPDVPELPAAVEAVAMVAALRKEKEQGND